MNRINPFNCCFTSCEPSSYSGSAVILDDMKINYDNSAIAQRTKHIPPKCQLNYPEYPTNDPYYNTTTTCNDYAICNPPKYKFAEHKKFNFPSKFEVPEQLSSNLQSSNLHVSDLSLNKDYSNQSFIKSCIIREEHQNYTKMSSLKGFTCVNLRKPSLSTNEENLNKIQKYKNFLLSVESNTPITSPSRVLSTCNEPIDRKNDSMVTQLSNDVQSLFFDINTHAAAFLFGFLNQNGYQSPYMKNWNKITIRCESIITSITYDKSNISRQEKLDMISELLSLLENVQDFIESAKKQGIIPDYDNAPLY